MDTAELDGLVREGLVSRRAHPDFPLSVYVYTNACVYRRAWTGLTRAARGLVVEDDTGRVVARPFPKFFNYGETTLPAGLFDRRPIATEKLDGSLVIVADDERHGLVVSTKGSFDSPHAQLARNLLEQASFDAWRPGVTYCFELIAPAHRVVVDYGDVTTLVLLATLDRDTGEDVPLAVDERAAFVAANQYELGTVDDAWRFATSNELATQEGIVLAWPRHGEPWFRLKMKHPDYVRLHAARFGLDSVAVWAALRDGGLGRLLSTLPDECHAFVRRWEGALTQQFDALLDEATRIHLVAVDRSTRREQAQFLNRCHHDLAPIVFKLLDGRDPSPLIWERLKPSERVPFAYDELAP